jgi:hypothetical protein
VKLSVKVAVGVKRKSSRHDEKQADKLFEGTTTYDGGHICDAVAPRVLISEIPENNSSV